MNDTSTPKAAMRNGTSGGGEARFTLFLIACSDCPPIDNGQLGHSLESRFTHTNPGNSAQISDMSSISALQLAVDHFRVERIVVCGHTGCPTIAAALNDGAVGCAGDWLGHVKTTSFKYRSMIHPIGSESLADAIAELNAIEQVANICRSGTVRTAWDAGRGPTVEGFHFDPSRREAFRLGMPISRFDDWRERHALAIDSFARRWGL